MKQNAHLFDGIISVIFTSDPFLNSHDTSYLIIAAIMKSSHESTLQRSAASGHFGSCYSVRRRAERTM